MEMPRRNGNRVVFEFLLFLHLLQALFFLRRAFPLGLFLNPRQFFIFLVRKALGVDVDILGLGSRFGCADDAFQLVKPLDVQRFQPQQFVVIEVASSNPFCTARSA